MLKSELMEVLESLDNIPYYKQSNKYQLIRKLLLSIDKNDVDLEAIPSKNILTQIIDLFIDCYDEKDLLDWLARHHYDVLSDFRFSDITYYDEVTNDEELEEIKENALFIDDQNGILVMYW